MLTAMIPIASTRCFITASMIDSNNRDERGCKCFGGLLRDAVHAPPLAAYGCASRGGWGQCVVDEQRRLRMFANRRICEPDHGDKDQQQLGH